MVSSRKCSRFGLDYVWFDDAVNLVVGLSIRCVPFCSSRYFLVPWQCFLPVFLIESLSLHQCARMLEHTFVLLWVLSVLVLSCCWPVCSLSHSLNLSLHTECNAHVSLVRCYTRSCALHLLLFHLPSHSASANLMILFHQYNECVSSRIFPVPYTNYFSHSMYYLWSCHC